MAEVFSEYGLPYRLGTRGKSSEIPDESYFSGDLRVATLVKAFVPEGVALPDSQLVIFGTRDLFDDSDLVAAHQPRRKSKTATFLSDFRDLPAGDYVAHVEHRIGQYLALKHTTQ